MRRVAFLLISKKILVFPFLWVIFLFYFSSNSFAFPDSMAFDIKLAKSSSGVLNGAKDVSLCIRAEADRACRWKLLYPKKVFTQGFASFTLIDLKPDYFSGMNTVIRVEVDSIQVDVPIPAVPYAIYAKRAVHVDTIRAGDLTGAFTSTLNIQNDLIVGTSNKVSLFVDYDNQLVGVATSNPKFKLDVNGAINAGGFTIDGDSIYEKFSWKKQKDNSIVYNVRNSENQVRIGIATTNPKFELDVAGKINAQDLRVGGQTISQYLENKTLWNKNANSIYYTDGSVGIGTQNFNEQLVVSGAVRVAGVRSKNLADIQAGTIEYDGVARDFFGYAKDKLGNIEKRSLTGGALDDELENSKIPTGSILYFKGSKVMTATKNFVFDVKNGGLAIGTDNAAGLVTVIGDGKRNFFDVKSPQNKSIFTINSSGNVNVNGTIDASKFLVNGKPLEMSLSATSFWNQGKSDSTGTDLFYDGGNVGIGTKDPVNLLELSSSTDTASMTFDIQGKDLFTLGVDKSQIGKFFISQGSDLTNPVFTFQSDQKLGIGINTPNANLHVSGNAGILVEGAFDPTSKWEYKGPGSRMFFFPGRAAFRAGRVLGTQWDDLSIGDYSVAFGKNATASGNFSFVGGGVDNSALGDYSVVMGGLSNEARGSYSFAAGRDAIAKHDGVFIWSDATPSLNAFESSQSNQFLVRAYGGVGINTNETAGSSLVVARDDVGNILHLRGNDSNSNVNVSHKGQLAIGSSSFNDASLHVNGKVGVGTDKPIAAFQVDYNSSVSDYLFYANATHHPEASSKNVVVITASGNMGVGTLEPEAKLHVVGSLGGKGFAILGNDGEYVELSPSAGSPWSTQGKNIYRLQGNVGVGTKTPSSMLELSNKDHEKRTLPVIGFDLDGDPGKSFKLGVITKNSEVYFAIAPSLNFNSEKALFVITQNSVVIGRGAVTSNFALDVSGNVFVDGKFAIGTSNHSFAQDMFVNGSLAVMTLNIGGKAFVPTKSAWEDRGLNLVTFRKVGIGVTTPSTELEVFGTVSASILSISANVELKEQASLVTSKVHFMEGVGSTGKLFVGEGVLKYQFGDETVKNLSSPLTVSNEKKSGPLAFWVNENTLGNIPVFFNAATNMLHGTTNVTFRNFQELGDGLIVSNNVSLVGNEAFGLDASLSHRGDVNSVVDYTLQKLSLDIQRDWGQEATPVTIKGLDLKVAMPAGVDLKNRSNVVGMYVDVASVNVIEGATKFAGIFMGGNVGIGTETPQAALEVVGVVSANQFVASKGLDINQLTVDNINFALHVDTKDPLNPKVGIGTSNLTAMFEVVGNSVLENVDVLGGLVAVSMNIGSNAFVVDPSGNIGIGTANPSATFEIAKTLDDISKAYTAEKISLVIDKNVGAGSYFNYSQDITGLQLEIRSNTSNQIKNNTVRGLDIRLSSVNFTTESDVYGLYVDVGNDTDVVQKYAAIFNGGNVGIGTSNPTVELAVSGDIKANNLILNGDLVVNQRVTVDHLTVPKTASMNRVTINGDLHITGKFKAGSIDYGEKMEVDKAIFKLVTANHASINSLIVDKLSGQSIEAKSASFTTGFSVGTDNVTAGTLHVNGLLDLKSVRASDTVSAPTLSVGLGNNIGLFYGSDNRLGIGTSKPKAFVHIEGNDSSAAFNVANNETWNAMKMSVKDSVNNAVVGLLFAPDSTPSKSIGSGIVAQRVGSTQGSDLLFITDPSTGVPQERMRILNNGNIGIGTSKPTSLLDVVGTVNVRDDVQVSKLLTVSEIRSFNNKGITINAETGITLNGIVDISSDLIIQNALVLKPISKPVFSGSDNGFLYVDKTNDDLHFKGPSDAEPLNISAIYTGRSNRIPYFDTSGSFSDQAPFEYDSSLGVFTMGTTSSNTKFELKSLYDITAGSVLALESINVTFNRRDTGNGSTFTGSKIKFVSSPGDFGTKGRLGKSETAVGLHVDLSDLEYASDVGVGNKYAAVFQGGLVGVGTNAPTAMLHVVEDSSLRFDTHKALFKIDRSFAAGTQTVFVVSANRVGINEADPKAQLHVKGDVGDIVIISSNTGGRFVINQSGNLGVGLPAGTSPQHKLHVSGNARITGDLNVGKIFAERLTVSENITVSNAVFDNVTINASLILDHPTAKRSFLLKKDISSTDADFTAEKIDIELKSSRAGATPATFTGLLVDFDSKNHSKQDSSTTRLAPKDIAVGLHVDMSTMLGKYTGLGGEAVVPRKYAGVFSGGLIGIGTSTPKATLHIKQENITGWIADGALYKNDTNDVFRIDAGSTTHALFVNKEGKVGLNNAIPVALFDLKVPAGFKQAYFSVRDADNRAKLIVTDNAVGVMTEPKTGFALAVSGNILFQKDNSTPVFVVKDSKVGVGTESPSSTFEIKGSSTESLFKVKSNLNSLIDVHGSGKTVIGGVYNAASTPYKVNVVGDSGALVFSGPVSASDPWQGQGLTKPTDLSALNTPYGFLSINESAYMFLGSVTSNESLLLFGGPTSSTMNIRHVSDNESVDVMVFNSEGIGINQDPIAGYGLAVSGNFIVKNNAGTHFYVSDNVGIGGINSGKAGSLFVKEDVKFKSLEITDGDIKASTVNVSGRFTLTHDISYATTDFVGTLVSLNLSEDIKDKNLYGIKIQMQSEQSTDDDDKKLIAKGASAYGIHVDMSEVAVASDLTGTYGTPFNGNKYAALFEGGFVGIGTKVPEYLLHVEAQNDSKVAGFGTSEDTLVIYDLKDEGTMSLGVQKNVAGSSDVNASKTIGFKVDDTQKTTFVGIGTIEPDKSLVVNGSMRLGLLRKNASSPVAEPGYGSRLFFSGGPRVSSALSSDNGDDLWMARYNDSLNNSSLRLNFSTKKANDPSTDFFQVGYSVDSLTPPVLKVFSNDKVLILGDFGESKLKENRSPQATLHVVGSVGGKTNTDKSLVHFEQFNTDASSGTLLNLVRTTTVDGQGKFIEFTSGINSVGFIDLINKGKTARFVTTGGDYAEYLMKQEISERFEKGDIVAVTNGKITKDITSFQRLMVLSSEAAVAGNWPGDNEEGYELVAFLGQVKTKVRGAVRAGDYIVAEGNGVGVAISPEKIDALSRERVVGRAWESSWDKGEKLVNVAVGFDFGATSLKNEMIKIKELEMDLRALELERNKIIEQNQERIDDQLQRIDDLLSTVK